MAEMFEAAWDFVCGFASMTWAFLAGIFNLVIQCPVLLFAIILSVAGVELNRRLRS